MRIDRNELARLLAATTKVVESRNTIPILSTVRLVSTNQTLTATATDLDIEVTASAPADGDLAICVDARMLGDIVKKLPAGAEINMDVKDGSVAIVSGRSRFKLPVLPVTDFPTMDGGTFAAEFDIDLAALFAPVKFAISSEEVRYYLNGVFFHIANGKVVAVATDGHRLSRHIGPDAAAEFNGIIVPRKTVDIIPPGVVSLAVSATKVRVVKDGATILSKLIDGTFPDYQRVIPTGNDKHVRVTRDALAAAADRVSVVSSERGRAVKLSIGGGVIDLAVHGDGDANDSVPCEYDGEPVEIGFNSKYLVEALAQFPVGDITLELADSGGPARLIGGVEGLDLVLMPMRV